jgi:hypothetical protein
MGIVEMGNGRWAKWEDTVKGCYFWREVQTPNYFSSGNSNFISANSRSTTARNVHSEKKIQ